MLLMPISIGDNVFVGMNVTILPGTTVGNGTIIGSGSVVKGTIPDNVVVAGNPAKVIETVQEYCLKIRESKIKSIRF